MAGSGRPGARVPQTVAAVGVNAIIPILFYPYSKTIWMALDVLLHRMDRQDRDTGGNGDARAHVGGRRDLPLR